MSRRDRRKAGERGPRRPAVDPALDPVQADALLARLQPAIVTLHRSWQKTAPEDVRDAAVILAGSREGILRIVGSSPGGSEHAATLVPRAVLVGRLRQLEEPEIADALERGSAPDHIEVVLVTAQWVSLSELVPDRSTSPGGTA